MRSRFSLLFTRLPTQQLQIQQQGQQQLHALQIRQFSRRISHIWGRYEVGKENIQEDPLNYRVYIAKRPPLKAPRGQANQQSREQTKFRQVRTVLLSPWHDVPLRANTTPEFFNYINEIPKDTRAKMEVSTKEELNPIRQDKKKGLPRFFHNPIPFNYGCLPQTWENPGFVDTRTNCRGDNDPLDVVEVSDMLECGAVVPVKVLGAFALIDENETDWKIICIRVDHELATYINDITDFAKYMPNKLEEIHEWFKNYKTFDGKPPNTFAFDGKPINSVSAKTVIQQCNKEWLDLRKGKIDPKGLYINSVFWKEVETTQLK